MKCKFYYLFVALLTITMQNVLAQDSIPEGAIHLNQPATVSSYWIDEPGNYYCTSSIETQYKFGGGTPQNPIRIYIDGPVYCNQGQTELGSGPAFIIYGGCVEFIGINGGSLKNSIKNTIICSKQVDANADKEIPSTNGKRYINYLNDVYVTLRNLTIDRNTDEVNESNLLYFGSHIGFTATYNLENVTIQNFKAESNGAVAINDVNATCTFTNCTFKDNNLGVDKTCGGVYANAGTATFNNCTFTNNCGSYGGSLRIGANGKVTLNDCNIANSTATNTAKGAVYMANGGTLTLKGNTTITTQTKGGNIYLATGAKFTPASDWFGEAGVTVQNKPMAETPTRQITTNGSPEVGTITSDNNNLFVEYVSGATPYHQLLVPTISEDADNTEIITYLNGHTNVSINLDRTIKTGGYNTICLPFALSNSKLKAKFGDDVILKRVAGSSYVNEKLELELEDATSIEAGIPYLISVSANTPLTPGFDGVTFANTLTTTETTYCDFVPVYNPTHLENDNKNILFLIGNNQLYYPDSNKYTADMRGLRAYFTLKGDAMQARTFALAADGQTTAIALPQETARPDTEKPMYDIMGLQVNSNYHGMVIQNGKKFIIRK